MSKKRAVQQVVEVNFNDSSDFTLTLGYYDTTWDFKQSLINNYTK